MSPSSSWKNIFRSCSLLLLPFVCSPCLLEAPLPLVGGGASLDKGLLKGER